MVAPPLLDVHSYFFIELDSHWIIQRVMIFQSWPIPHKLCIVNYQSLPDTTSHDQMEQAVKLKSDFETRDTRRQMVDINTFNSVSFER